MKIILKLTSVLSACFSAKSAIQELYERMTELTEKTYLLVLSGSWMVTLVDSGAGFSSLDCNKGLPIFKVLTLSHTRVLAFVFL